MGGIPFADRRQDRPRADERRLAALAARQHGLVTTAQLNVMGFDSSAIWRRIRGGRLHPVHRGVHAVGHRGLTFEARCLAAVMAAGRGAVLSHRAAAALWGLVSQPPEPFDVTTQRRSREGSAGIVLHRSRHPAQASRHRGVPVTTVLRTLLDLAATVSQPQMERAVREAHALWLVRRPELVAFVDRAAGIPGAPALREALGREAASRSRAERAFLDLCRREGVEPALQNESVAGQSVDFFWPAHNLVVETDGYATHATRHGFEHDRELDATLARAGVRVLRFSGRQIEGRPDRVLETLSALGVLPRSWRG